MDERKTPVDQLIYEANKARQFAAANKLAAENGADYTMPPLPKKSKRRPGYVPVVDRRIEARRADEISRVCDRCFLVKSKAGGGCDCDY